MIAKKPPGVFIVISFLALPAVFGLTNGYAQITQVFSAANLPNLPSKTVELDRQQDQAAISWNILDKLREKDDELARTPVSFGSREITYYENRISLLPYNTEAECVRKRGKWDESAGVCKSVIRKKSSEKEMILGLKLLNVETGEVSVVRVSTRVSIDGVSIVAPAGYQIEIVERPNGIKWNLWNTLYQVVSPANTVVIKNNFPKEVVETVSSVVKGKVVKNQRKFARGFLYVPHLEFFEQDEQGEILAQAGINQDKNAVAQAFAILKEKGVRSRAFPDKFVADVEPLSPRFFERLVLLEQGDFTEFQLDPEKTTRRTLMILGANGEDAWRYTCNGSGACGWVQFTSRTYADMRKFFPTALLERDFKTGAADHVNSIMAAILLYDNNLAALLRRFGDRILTDPRLEEYLAASYNGAPKWAHNSLAATISRGLSDWVTALSPTRKDSRGGLRKETRDFMAKLRYLVANNLP